MSDPADDLRSQFRAAMRRHPAAVTIVTAADDRRHHGMTATAVTSLSLEPPSLLVCVNQTTLLHDILLAARRFCVNLLGSGQADVSGAFSGALPPGKRFDLGLGNGRPKGSISLRTRRRISSADAWRCFPTERTRSSSGKWSGCGSPRRCCR